MKEEFIVIESGIKRPDIERWLETVAVRETADTWISEGWKVELGPQQQVPTGPFFLPRTKVTFSGEANKCQEYVDAFRLQFLSAGG